MKKLFSTILSLFLLAVILVKPAMAQTTPDFPTCSNPTGTLKVHYDTGIHAIAGDQNAYTGSDSVYTIDGERTMQCFCAESGNGIQTNWWKISSLTQEEIDTLVKLGWVFVPDGAAWGLESGIYMALNSTYSCGGGRGGDGGTGGGSTGGSNTSGPAVLGLAATGDSAVLYVLLAVGISSILLGLALKRN